MATTDATRRVARRRRSLVFYAWGGFVLQVVLGIGMIIFVVVGSSYQRSAIQTNARVHRLQLTNLSMQSSFLDAERALRGYELTGQDRFLQSYYTDRVAFAEKLRLARTLAWREVLPGLTAQAGLAAAAFRASDRAVAAPRGSHPSRVELARAGDLSDTFVTASGRFQGSLSGLSAQLSDQSQRSLGIGLLATAVVLVVGLMVPVGVGALLVGRTVVPLHSTTDVVRRLADGDHAARAAAVGPAETRELAASLNFLADESDRLRAEQEERTRLTGMVRDTAVRVREHLEADEVIREAVAALRENLAGDYAWVGLITEGKLVFPPANPDLGLLTGPLSAGLPARAVEFSEELYRERASYWLKNLRAREFPEIPGPVRDAFLHMGIASMLFIPFGAGREPLGILVLARTDPGQPWTPAERAAAESIASDLARGLDHAQLYQQEKELVEKLKEVDRAKSDFLAAVSHDLRTPLTSIVGYTEMLDEDEITPLSDAQHQMVRAIDRNAARLGNLIEDVLTMSRIEMGEFRTVLKPVDLAAVARGVAEEMRGTVTAKGLDFILTGPAAGLPVSGSAEQLDRALTNLLSNAVKYTPHGGSVIVTTGREDGQALVSIRDSGIGVPQQDQPSLFTRFFRASNVATGSIPGTGLGLAIVRTIVENHNGDVALQSREGEGTTVTVRLPLLPDERTAEPRGNAA